MKIILFALAGIAITIACAIIIPNSINWNNYKPEITQQLKHLTDRKLSINGNKMFISNGEHGNAFAVLARTDPDVQPPHKGISCFVVEKPAAGFTVAQKLDKLGYRGIDTTELVFDNVRIPTENLVGENEGRGFGQVMSALEGGRINVAARAVGVEMN